MTFAAPAFLWVLLLVPLGAAGHVLAVRRRRRYAVRLPAAATLAAIVGREPAWRRRLPLWLLGLAVAALAVALARPQKTVAVPVQRASIMLIMDASRSMSATDVAPSRLEAAQRAGERFLHKVPKSVQVGLVGFSDTPDTVQAPSDDHNSVLLTLEALQPEGGTATGDAINAALAALDQTKENGHRPPSAIVLLSDGKWTNGQDPVLVARRAKAQHIPIYTVALGTPGGLVPGPFGQPLPVPPDPQSLRQIALASGGRAYTAQDADQLDSVYEHLGSQVGSKPKKREVTSEAAGAGLFLLAAAVALGLRRRARIS